MRLINTKTLELEDIPGQPPPYAILSHTWEKQEITYHEFQDDVRRVTREGFKKIVLACEQAKKDGLEYVWVDTCCIDKSSSAELSEAINSMFKWYRGAKVCYAYLSDMLLPPKETGDIECTAESEAEWWSMFRASKWFTRGWTLQELIAPREMAFYDCRWTKIGSKTNLRADISRATGISVGILVGQPLSSVSVAKRMSWASNRKTTREEDIAYCLMGIFDVNMPMLYGEGSKAFIRLQEEILKETDDQSLFAWRASPESAQAAPYRGILAASPDEFIDCEGIMPFRNFSMSQGMPMGITARGVPLTGIIEFSAVGEDGERMALLGLNCRRGYDFQNIVAIKVVPTRGDQFLRCNPSELFSCASLGSQQTVYVTKAFHAARVERLPLFERQFAFYLSEVPEGVRVSDVYPRNARYNPHLRLLELGPWIKDKACIQLEVSWSPAALFLFLWASRPPNSIGYQAAFLPSIVYPAENNLVDRLGHAKKPKEYVDDKNVEEKQVVSFGAGAPTVVITVRQKTVQGFDMFCVEMRLSRETTSSSSNKRVPSLYSIRSRR